MTSKITLRIDVSNQGRGVAGTKNRKPGKNNNNPWTEMEDFLVPSKYS
jgi:hypothetical protein